MAAEWWVRLKTKIALFAALFCIVLLSICNYIFTSHKTDHPCFIKDNYGRIVIYHGVNVSNESKDKPYGPKLSYDELKKIPDYGFNFVRYLIFWSAIEPTKGVYDTAYMRETKTRLQQLKSIGLDVAIDFHQDLYAEKFTGNGFPEWSIDDKGIPFHQQTPWNKNYLEPAVVTAYNSFWGNDSLVQKYVDVVDYALSWFDSLIVGVDIMNEPFPGTNELFEQTSLTDLYTKVQTMMKTKGYKCRRFFEPWMCTSAGLPSLLKFKPDPTDVYFPHYYDPLVHEGGTYGNANKVLMQKALPCKVSEGQKFGVPTVFGEFAISGDLSKYIEYLTDFLNIADSLWFGWTYYSYDTYTKNNFDSILSPLSRIYPQRIAGTDPEIQSKPNSFCLTYNACGIPAPTIIFIPSRYKNVVIKVNDTLKIVTGNKFVYTASTGPQNILIEW